MYRIDVVVKFVDRPKVNLNLRNTDSVRTRGDGDVGRPNMHPMFSTVQVSTRDCFTIIVGDTAPSDGDTALSDGDTALSDGGTAISDGGTALTDGGTARSDGVAEMLPS